MRVLGHRAGAYYTGRMRLATLRDGTRDGALIVVGRDGGPYARAGGDRADAAGGARRLGRARRRRWRRWRRSSTRGARRRAARRRARWARRCRAPTSGSTARRSSNHVRLVRKARGAAPPADAGDRSARLPGRLGRAARAARRHPARRSGLGPRLRERGRGHPRRHAAGHARRRRRARTCASLMLANDITLREPGRPTSWPRASASSSRSRRPRSRRSRSRPTSWAAPGATGASTCRVRTTYNGALVGDPDAGEMHFSFFDLIAHIARTRAFAAGTILGSGTVSNADRARGVSCLAERRAIETIDGGHADDAVHDGGRHDRDRDARRRRARPLRPHRAAGGGGA